MKTLFAVLSLLALTACASPTAPDPAPWSPAYDADWSAVIDCYAARDFDTSDTPRPEVVVRDDCRSKWADQDFNIGGDAWVHGRYSHGHIEVCPDLAALRHELSHHVAHHVGAENVNGAGECWL